MDLDIQFVSFADYDRGFSLDSDIDSVLVSARTLEPYRCGVKFTLNVRPDSIKQKKILNLRSLWIGGGNFFICLSRKIPSAGTVRRVAHGTNLRLDLWTIDQFMLFSKRIKMRRSFANISLLLERDSLWILDRSATPL